MNILLTAVVTALITYFVTRYFLSDSASEVSEAEEAAPPPREEETAGEAPPDDEEEIAEMSPPEDDEDFDEDDDLDDLVLGKSRSAPSSSSGSDGDGESNHSVVRVYYGTDRARSGKTRPNEFYGGDRGELEYGYCDVSIPKTHKVGELEAPSKIKLEFRENPDKHVVLLDVSPVDRKAFWEEINGIKYDADKRQAFVFVHGYNVRFKDAARRAAQMYYDLNIIDDDLGFIGTPYFYSWPSKGDIKGYNADEATILWSVLYLKTFLLDVATTGNYDVIHVIAHSMGNRAVTRALAEIARENPQTNIREIILAAPDIDGPMFKRDIVPALLSGYPGGVTLYASDKDKALQVSKTVHQMPRAGDAGINLVVVPGLDSVDASEIDTDFLSHSYFGSAPELIRDILQLFNDHSEPSERGLDTISEVGGQFWRFKKPLEE